MNDEPILNQFVTSAGRKIKLGLVSIFRLEQLRVAAEKNVPPIPSYTVEIAGGAKQTFQHAAPKMPTPIDEVNWMNYLNERPDSRIYDGNETTIQTHEQRVEWLDYLDKKNAAEADATHRQELLFYWKGISDEVPNDGWEQDQLEDDPSIVIPTDKRERKMHWVKTELLGSPQEQMGLFAAIMRLSGVADEEVEAAEASFQDQVRRTRGTAALKPESETGQLVA